MHFENDGVPTSIEVVGLTRSLPASE